MAISRRRPDHDGLRLAAALVDVVLNLLIEARLTSQDVGAVQQRCGRYLASRPEERTTLVEGLTRALADPSYLRVFLRFLDEKQVPLLPYEDLIPDDRVARFLRGGPGLFTDGELAWLALVPEQLAAFHEVVGERMTRFWVHAIDDAMAQAARERGETRLSTHELTERILERVEERSVEHGVEMVPLETVSTSEQLPPTAQRNYKAILKWATQVEPIIGVVPVTPTEQGFVVRFSGKFKLPECSVQLLQEGKVYPATRTKYDFAFPAPLTTELQLQAVQSGESGEVLTHTITLTATI